MICPKKASHPRHNNKQNLYIGVCMYECSSILTRNVSHVAQVVLPLYHV